MSEIALLARRFWVQLALRSLLTSVSVVAVVAVFALLTSPADSSWFAAFPAIASAGRFIQQHNPWDFFILAFVVTTALSYLRQIQDAIWDRWNLGVLVSMSEARLEASENPLQGLGALRAGLGLRRRLLESLLAFVPTLVQGLVVAVLLWVAGLPLAGMVCLVVAVGTAAAVPWMTARFARRRAEVLAERPAVAVERVKDPWIRARRAFAQTTSRLRVLVDRPIERLRVGWPLTLFAVLGGAAIAWLTIEGMSSAGELPRRSTLLIVFLILAARAVLSAAQRSEDVAFFATAVEDINGSDDGSEAL